MVNDIPDDDGLMKVVTLLEGNEATEYSIATDVKAGECKLEFFNEYGSLSTFIGGPDEIYSMAQRLLRAYDKLEGL